MQSKAKTVKEYVDSLPPDRKKTINAIRKVFRANIDKDFKEGMQYGAISYFLPRSKYPWGYHCDPEQELPFAGLASQKNHIGISLFCVYFNEAAEKAFREDWRKSGKRLDMGKSCVRVKKLEDVPLDVLARALRRISAKQFIASYEKGLEGFAGGRKFLAQRETKDGGPVRKAAGKKTAAKKAAAKKTAAKKTAARKTAAKKTARKKARRA